MRSSSAAIAVAVSCVLGGCLAGEAEVEDDQVATDSEEVCCGANCCFIDGACRGSGEINSNNQCQSCQPALDQFNWTTESCPQNGVFCDGPEECVPATGACESTGEPVGLDDGIPCTTDACDEDNDEVTHTPDDDFCDDGEFCTGTETCSVTNGCESTPPAGLDDGVDCTVDTCDESTQSFQHTPDDGVCDDGMFCNGDETCDSVMDCQAGTPPVVSDGVACTDDSCDEANDEIVNAANDGNCDDGLFCNGAETCDPVNDCRAGTPPDVSDGVACTDDSCDEANDEIVNAPNHGFCDDTLFCNGAEVCDEVMDCQGGTPPVVSDGVSCTADACDEVDDVVTHMPDDGFCDDGMRCTADSCDAVDDCQNVPIPACGPDAGVTDAGITDAAMGDAAIADAAVDDAGVDAPIDAIGPPDAVGLDGPGRDAGIGEEPGGCGCASGRDGAPGTLLLVIAVVLALARRRAIAVLAVLGLLAGCAAEPDGVAVDGSSQAGPITELRLDCDDEYTWTTFYESGARMVQTHWYAELDMPGFDPMDARGVDTVMCEYEQLGPALGACPEGAECTGQAPPPNYRCQVYDHAELGAEKIRVFCGTRQEYTPPALATNDNSSVSGFRWGEAHLRIEMLR